MRRGAKLAAVAAMMMAAGVPLVAQRTDALARLTPGQWQLKEVGGEAPRSLCIADLATVLQLAHPRAQCTRAVIANEPNALTVHYTCPGAGHGRSVLTVRGASSFRLQTQGLVAGAPFVFDYDARRTGDCAIAAAAPAPAPSPSSRH